MIEFLIGQPLPSLPFVVCDADGQVLRVGSCPAQMMLLQAKDGELVRAGYIDSSTQYVDVANSAVANKMEIVPIVDGASVSGLPLGCTAIVEEQSFTEANGAITFHFDVPGTYQVVLTAKNHLPTTIQVVQP